MPLLPAVLSLCNVGAAKCAGIDLLILHRANDADLIVASANFAVRVDDGMNVQLRRRRLSRKLTQALCQLLLQSIVDLVLGTEEDNSSL